MIRRIRKPEKTTALRDALKGTSPKTTSPFLNLTPLVKQQYVARKSGWDLCKSTIVISLFLPKRVEMYSNSCCVTIGFILPFCILLSHITNVQEIQRAVNIGIRSCHTTPTIDQRTNHGVKTMTLSEKFSNPPKNRDKFTLLNYE